MMINKYLVPSNNFSPTFQHSTVPFSRFLTNSTLSQVSSLTRTQEMHACKYKLSTLTRIYDPGIVSNNTILITIRIKQNPTLLFFHFLSDVTPKDWIELIPYRIQLETFLQIHYLACISSCSWVQCIDVQCLFELSPFPVVLLVQKMIFSQLISWS